MEPSSIPRTIRETLDLPHETYTIWWDHLDETDRDEFRYIFGGDEIHARLVCALDQLILAGTPPDDVSLIATAYVIAAAPYAGYAISPTDPTLGARALQAYRHDSVQSLLERVKYRSTRRKRLRLENLVYSEAEAMVKDAALRNDANEPIFSMLDRKAAVDSARALMKLADEEDAVVRSERSRRGMTRARDAVAAGLSDDNPRVLKTMFKALVAKIGTDAARALIPIPVDTEIVSVIESTP